MKELFFSFAESITGSNYPLIGLFLVSFSESSFFPIPPDTILIPLSIFNPKMSFFYAGITTIASVIGGVLGYFIGRFGGKPVVNKFISEEKLYSVKLYYNKYDVWAIIIAGFTPIPYKIFSISAGLFDLNLKKFILSSFIGRGGRFFLIAGLIYFFGETIKNSIEKYFEIFSIGFVVLLVLGFYVVNKLLKRQSPDKKEVS